jgi:hypothetical protein
MKTLGQQVQRIRSKNAGPFWVTIDIFCGSKEVYQNVLLKLENKIIIDLFKIPGQTLKKFQIQGHITDRDMHGAQFAVLLSEIEF